MLLIILGAAGIVLSAILTKQRFNKSRLPPKFLKHTAGTGLVPSWVSFLNIVSWVVLGIGVLSLFF